jgi:PAB-dependent poly(A)-specific ribonuclease subunit 2
MSSLRQVDGLAFAQMPRELQGKRNVISSAGPKRQGRFRSEKARRRGDVSSIAQKVTAADAPKSPPPESPVDAQRGDRVPRHYQRVEIEYSKFGVEDFDFAFVDSFILMPHLTNGKVLQQDSIQWIGDSYSEFLYQRTGPGHALCATTPPSCQISYHDTMCPRILPALRVGLCDAHVGGRQRDQLSSNQFLQDYPQLTFRSVTMRCDSLTDWLIATTYGVVDYVQDGQETNYGAKIQIFNRFLVENLKVEGNTVPRNPVVNPAIAIPPSGAVPSPITQLLSINSKSVTICDQCKCSREKPDTAHIVDMIYPRRVSP